MKTLTFDVELFNRCYEAIASKGRWQNRDFDDEFDKEVDDLFIKICSLLKINVTF